jgi:hypothetical protein
MTAVSMLLDHIGGAAKNGRADKLPIKLMAILIDKDQAAVSRMLRELEELRAVQFCALGRP